MAQDPLPPDPNALEKWRSMPQNQPSGSALPPAAGGTRWVWGLMAAVALIIVLGFVLERAL